jgi:hypothetical protein
VNTEVKGGLPEDLVAQVEKKIEEIKSGAFTTPVDEKTPPGSVELKS